MGKSPAAAPRAGPRRLGGGRFAPAWGAEVVSSNIVGYQKVALAKGLNLVGSQFVQVGEGDVPFELSELTNMKDQPSFDESLNAQTTIRFFTGVGYDYYGWSGNLTVENPDMAEELADELELDDPSVLNNHWLNSSYEISDEEALTGQGFWIYAANAGTITMSGQVIEDTTKSFPLVAGLNLVSCPWPINLSMINITVDNGQPSFDSGMNAQTSIRVFTGVGYDYYGWSGNLTGENPDMAEELADELEIDDPSTLNYHWLDSSYSISEYEIPAGKGFWIYANKAGTVTFKR